ncbi:MAG: carbamoyl phosphate synthase small subunit [Euryarchaeota archaeon]|nr:carbamoyl phosphate synthase small subunit [Euryarchaeota archaeon]MEC7703657.1 glutamine-hydrolyzing carbamoyl-phosphate synthase small subunit [Candidatus Thermoplasmatota archaeon]
MTVTGGFTPGSGQHGVSKAFIARDAADLLLPGTPSSNHSEAKGRGVLLLADGSRFEGDLFGAATIAEGELVFTTNMTGYQESLTDPSFAGQVLTFTWPLLGNYGILPGISESAGVWPRGVVCRELMLEPDHRDCIGTVHDLLLAHGVPGISGVDTRAITRRVREYGVILSIFGPLDREEEMLKTLGNMKSPDIEDLADEVSRNDAVLLNEGATDSEGNPLPRVAALDCGIKYNILRELCARFEVLWCPPEMDWDELQTVYNIDALFCSNGPGDPAHPGKATSARHTLAKATKSGIPVMGICLGHQLMGLASGLRTYKLRYGHRGGNQPVLDLQTQKVSITSQNHGFAVEDPVQGMLAPHPSGANSGDVENLHGCDVEVRYVNANDRTVEGLDVKGRPAFTIQFHPEACPGPHDASPLFDRFADLITQHLEVKANAKTR